MNPVSNPPSRSASDSASHAHHPVLMTVYYDESCPLCRAEMHNLMRRNALLNQVAFVDASAVDFVPPAGKAVADLMRVLHLQTAQGTWMLGVDAFVVLYQTLGLPWVSRVLSAPVLHPLAVWLYPVVARHRHRIPRWLTHRVFESGVRHAAEHAHAQVQPCASGGCVLPASKSARG
jgi:predicted DCC family thiol-disulfide oxidoreductase YuxK